jgi:hypothetical protein
VNSALSCTIIVLYYFVCDATTASWRYDAKQAHHQFVPFRSNAPVFQFLKHRKSRFFLDGQELPSPFALAPSVPILLSTLEGILRVIFRPLAVQQKLPRLFFPDVGLGANGPFVKSPPKHFRTVMCVYE